MNDPHALLLIKHKVKGSKKNGTEKEQTEPGNYAEFMCFVQIKLNGVPSIVPLSLPVFI